MKIKSIFFGMLLALSLSAGCFDSSGSDDNGRDTGEPADGVYAKLIVGRLFYTAMPIKTDTIEALFSGYYDPCASESDLRPSGVTCNAYTLAWNDMLYKYSEIPDSDGFLSPGLTYTFSVTASSEVPALTASITFPATEPVISSPEDGDSVSSAGFTVEWDDDAGSGTVTIILLDMSANVVSVETADDGSYTFNASQISGISGMCYLQVEKHNQENIDADGYDSRSIIRARHMCSTMITLN